LTQVGLPGGGDVIIFIDAGGGGEQDELIGVAAVGKVRGDIVG
jgi:hypothetical protein